MTNLNIGALLKAMALTVCLFSINFIQAQEPPEGVSLQNQWLKFENEEVFLTTLQQLEAQYEDWAVTPEDINPDEEEPCDETGSPLEAFENNFEGFLSLRKSELLRECAHLENGGDPSDFEETWLPDEIIGSLISKDYQYQVGSDIFILFGEGLAIKVQNEDIDAVYAVMAGANPYELGNVSIVSTDSTSTGSCNADFEFSGFSGTMGSFTFTGSPESVSDGTISYKWDFGDGQTSTDMNPSHTYSSTNDYNVCVEVTVTSNDPNQSCTSKTCKLIKVGGDCMPPLFVWNETGVAGQLHFTDISSILSGTITSWNWDFGDGNSSTQQNPTHTYACDKTYFVTLTITTDDGCQTFITIPIEVTSHNCCGKGKDKGEVVYGNNKIKYNQHHVNIPLIRRVVAQIKHYKRKSNGKYKKQRADLKVDLTGDVYTKNGVGCKCEMPHSIVSSGLGANKKTYTHRKSIGQGFRAKDGKPWSATYTVNGAHIATKTSQVYCK